MKRVYAAVAVFVALACGSSPSNVVTGAPGHRDVLFDAEIQTNKTPGMTIYDLVERLRPEYLRSRGSNSFKDTAPPTAIVYVDGARYGALEQMKSLSADRVFQIQYLSASSAQTRLGMDHTGGAILITSK